MFNPKSASYKIQMMENSKLNIESNVTTSSQEQLTNVEEIPSIIPKPVSKNYKELSSDTHFFDGKLYTAFLNSISKNASEDIRNNINRVNTTISKEDKEQAFLELEVFITKLSNDGKVVFNQKSKMCLKAIMSSHNQCSRNYVSNPNYSSSDKLFACDLLYLIYEKIIIEKNHEYLTLLLTQLEEMATGLCPQGRVNRLFQTYVMLREDLTPTSNV